MTSASKSDNVPYDPATEGWYRDDEPGFVELMGPVWVKRVGGILRHGLVLQPRHLNRSQHFHGGMVLALFDHAMGLVGFDAADAPRQVTIQLDTHFIGVAVEGDFVEAQGMVVRQTGTFIFMAGTCTCGDRLIATANGIWKKLRK